MRPLVEGVVRGRGRDVDAEVPQDREVLRRRRRRRHVERAHEARASCAATRPARRRTSACERLPAALEVPGGLGRVEDQVADEGDRDGANIRLTYIRGRLAGARTPRQRDALRRRARGRPRGGEALAARRDRRLGRREHAGARSACRSWSSPGPSEPGRCARCSASASARSPQSAVLVNGALAHALDFEDAHDGAARRTRTPPPFRCCSPSPSRAGGVTGRDFLAAMAVGCDLTCRLSLPRPATPARGLVPAVPPRRAGRDGRGGEPARARRDGACSTRSRSRSASSGATASSCTARARSCAASGTPSRLSARSDRGTARRAGGARLRAALRRALGVLRRLRRRRSRTSGRSSTVSARVRRRRDQLQALAELPGDASVRRGDARARARRGREPDEIEAVRAIGGPRRGRGSSQRRASASSVPAA